jgi:hypothetical protein
MENFGIFYAHLEYITVIWNILQPLGKFCGHMVYLSPFWSVVRNNLATPLPTTFNFQLSGLSSRLVYVARGQN